jgi:hypothetical protein
LANPVALWIEVGAWDWTVRRRSVGVESWSPEESGLKARDEFEDTPRSNSAKINSKDFVLCVPAVVRAESTAMAITNALPIRRGPRRRAFSVTFVLLAV